MRHPASGSKWSRNHAQHCGGDRDWLEAHAFPAGFTVIPRGRTGHYGHGESEAAQTNRGSGGEPE